MLRLLLTNLILNIIMKNNYIFICLLLISTSILTAQNNDFNNGGGDLLWSNTANWSLGVVPNTTNTGQVRLLLNSESLVNTPITIKKIQNTFGTTVSTPLGGASILTIDPGANNAYGFENVSDSDVNMIFNGLVTINNTGSGTTQTLMRNQNGNTNDTNSIVFGGGSTLTLTTNLELRTGTGGDNFNFNGTLAGSAALRISANTTATFGSTTNNTGFTGSIVYIGNPGLVVVNAADNNVFMPSGQKIQVNATGGEVELNGANVYQGNITVGGTNSFTMDLNKNQNSIGTVILSASGTLNLDVDATVTELAFADNSASSWGTGTINITGFKDGVIRFGTSNSGLTSAQLSQITVDDGSNGLALDSNGYLYSYDTSWTGTSSTDWSTGGNWSNGVPTSGQDVLIGEVTNAPIISGSTSATLGDLIIDEADGLTVSSGGSLIVNGNSSGNLTYNRNLPTLNQWYLVSSPVSGETFADMRTNHTFVNGTVDTDHLSFAPYNNAATDVNQRWDYITTSTNGTLGNAQGYLARLNTAGDISFTGTMNTSDFTTINLTDNSGASGTAFNFLGNPYPSYINISSLLTANDSGGNNLLTESTIWIWNGSSYDERNSGTALPNDHIAPAQGFFVSADGGSSTFTITEAMQSHQGTDSFQKNANPRPEVKLLMSNNGLVRDAKLFYIDGTTTDFDNGFDSSIFSGLSNSLEVYTSSVSGNNNKRLGIQSLPNSDFENMVVPVGIIADSGKEISFSVDALNMPSGIKVFLEDRENNIVTRLDENNTNYKITLNNTLNGTGRFYLHTRSSALSTDDVSLKGVGIYKVNKNTLRISGVNSSSASVKVFNILGRKVVDQNFSSKGVYDVSLPNLNMGVYIVQLSTGKGKMNKKIVLE